MRRWMRSTTYLFQVAEQVAKPLPSHDFLLQRDPDQVKLVWITSCTLKIIFTDKEEWLNVACIRFPTIKAKSFLGIMDSPLIPGFHSHLLGTLDPYRLGTTLRNSPAKGRMGCDFCDFCYAHPTSTLGSQTPPALKKFRPGWKRAAISVISVIFGVSLAPGGANCSREMWLPSKSNQVPRAKSELEFAFAPRATAGSVRPLLPHYLGSSPNPPWDHLSWPRARVHECRWHFPRVTAMQ